MKKRFLAIALSLCMVLSLLPMSAFATGGSNILIQNMTDMQAFLTSVSGGTTYEGYTVTLGANLGMKNFTWTPGSFKGTFDGNGYTLYNVENNLFDDTTGATIKNLTFVGAKPTSGKAFFVDVINGTIKGTLNNVTVNGSTLSSDGNGTITVHDTVILNEKVTINGNVEIQGPGTIFRADNYTGTLFAVNSGATLTLDGGLVIDGGNNYVFDKNAYDTDVSDWNTSIAKDNSAKWFTPEEGAPVASAFMITTTGGTVNLNKVTVQNNYSTTSGVISAGTNSTVTLTGAKITHVASTQGNGVVANVSGAEINVTVNEGTVIDGNHVGGNHGLFKIYSGAKLTMNGGEITNNTGWNSNGVAVGVYWGTFHMNGGTICSNTGVYGPSNGRNAAIYLHSGHTFEMKDGTICHNSGRARGGIDAPYDNGTAKISGGKILDNISRGNGNTPDVLGTSAMEITGGTFTQDVTEFLAPNYGLAYNKETGTYTVTTEIAEVNGTVYASLANAIENATVGSTVTVLASHKPGATAVIDKDITLDLNGKNLLGYSTVNPIVRVLADVTVTGNGMIDSANQGDGYCFIVGSTETAGNLTIENGTFYGDTSAASVTKGTLTINGGNFAVNPYKVDGQEDNYNFLLNCIDANYKNGSAKINVKGGNFHMFNPENNAAEGKNTNFVAKGYKAVENKEKENIWSVVRDSQTVKVVIYRNGDMTKPYKTVDPGLDVIKGETLDLTKLDINDYYSSAQGFKFDGWYNDGGWNNYKAGNPNNKLGDSITINGWTNIICMVNDYEKVVVKAVTDGDKDNAETIHSGKALKGSDLTDYLNKNVDAKEKTGYTLDKWYNWDWYGQKVAADATVNGWTNVYVTYTANDYTITFNSNGGSSVEPITQAYGTTITAPANPTYDGYNFVGWDPALPETMPAGDLTVTAQWEKDPVKTSSKYQIIVEDTENGKVTTNRTSASRGTTVTITAIPDAGYELAHLVVLDKNGNSLEVTTNANGTYSFKMPASKVTVQAGFSQAAYDCPSEKFIDVDQSLWYHEGIDYAIVNNLMNGVADNLFVPNGTTNRAMIVTILYRLEGSPAAEAPAFSDVAGDQWYTDAVGWAAANGIVTGYDEDTFGPLNPITREQMAAILYRYADSKGYDVSAGQDTNLLSFTDAESVSEYAMTAMQWAVGESLINGVEGNALAPQGTASRAQVATILMRFCENVVK